MTRHQTRTLYRQAVLRKRKISPIEHAIVLAGGTEAKLADATGYSQVAISKALRLGLCGPRLALAIHHATNGQVSASDIRPDIWESPDCVPAKRAS